MNLIIDAYSAYSQGYDQGYVSGIVLLVLLGLIVFCAAYSAWKACEAHAARQRSHPQDVRDALQRELRAIERESGRAARLTSQRFLLDEDELSTRRRSS